jgi:hypothetical protein
MLWKNLASFRFASWAFETWIDFNHPNFMFHETFERNIVIRNEVNAAPKLLGLIIPGISPPGLNVTWAPMPLPDDFPLLPKWSDLTSRYCA